MRTHKGKFKPKNPQKYKGDVTNICYRSSWELHVLIQLDNNPNVLEYSSEEIVVTYTENITEGHTKWRRYFPDFWVKMINKEGNVEEILIEVKPFKETIPPVLQKTSSRKYLKEVMTWGINSAKWKAAEEYCKKRNWKFVKLTEKELFGA